MIRPLRFAAILTLFACVPAFAHDYYPNSDAWCAGGQIVTVGPFDLSGDTVGAFAASQACPTGIREKDCGVFDDDYHAALTLATAQCTSLAGTVLGIDRVLSVTLLVEHPSSFLSDTHHQHYSAGQGVRGQCRACRIGPGPAPGPGGAGH